MSSRSSRFAFASTAWIQTGISPRGHPNPRPLPPERVLPEWGAAALAFLGWAYYHWPADEQLRDWWAAAKAAEAAGAEAERAHWGALAEAFRDMFGSDLARAARRDGGVFIAPSELYSLVGSRQHAEEDKIKRQLGGGVLHKYAASWKQGTLAARAAKRAFLESAGTEARWRAKDTTDAQREEAWAHVLALVALTRALFPPRDRGEAEFPWIFDMALKDAHSAVPRDAAVTAQPPAWHAAVLAVAQERYRLYVRKALDPSRLDGHPVFPRHDPSPPKPRAFALPEDAPAPSQRTE
jgi:hypothetical protein